MTEDVDELVAETTVDSYNEDEALSGFEAAFDDEVRLPLSGEVVGEQVQVVSVGLRDGRRELIATCERAGRRHHVALLDVDLSGDAAVTRLVAAYRRWLGP
jgi:hypothetical protein